MSYDMIDRYQLIYVCSLFLLLLITNQNNPINALALFQKNDMFGLKTLEGLKDFALTQINEDRKNFGLEPLLQSNNSAAQIQANEILKTGSLSHLTTDGLKPYMLYSLYNGTGYVQQNVAQIRYVLPTDEGQKNDQKSSNVCKNNDNNNIYCPILDPYKAIKDLEYSMINNDSKCCSDGHKSNILNKFHTHVSLGIAYNKYHLVLVQNFENQYLGSNYTIEKNENEIKLQARILDQSKYNFTINHVSFFLDDHPTNLSYEKNKNKNSYDLGDLKLMVSKPLSLYEKYVQGNDSYRIVEADKWNSTTSNINLEMNLPGDLSIENRVLTMVVYGESIENNIDSPKENDYIPLTSYTFFNS